jgi:hypothetical protein
MRSLALAVSAETDVDHALFVRSTGQAVLHDRRQRRSRSDERKERGWVPEIELEQWAAVRDVLGMDVADRHDCCACPLPGHSGVASLDTRLHGADRFELVLWCDCLSGERTVTVTARSSGNDVEVSLGPAGPHWYSLADAYLAVQTGRVLERGFRSRYRLAWRLLLDVDLGRIEAAHVDLPAPTEEASALAWRAAELFQRLYAAQLGAGWELPGLFAVGLVREWLGCSQGAAHEAIRRLIASGVIRPVGSFGRAFLYRPGGVVVGFSVRPRRTT